MPGLRMPAPVPIVIPKRRKLSLSDELAILMRWWLESMMRSRTMTERVTYLRSIVRCAGCGKRIPYRQDYEYDHEIPREISGDDSIANMRPYCITCHKVKTASDARLIAKGRRIRGEKGRRNPNRKPRKKIPSRPWPKRRTEGVK